MSHACKVIAVIPTYNRAALLETAINSVRNQTITNFKILVIDDGSTDNTQEIVNSYIEADRRISYYRMPQNMGICRVLNKALELVDTKYMIQVDSDDWLQPEAIETLLLAMENQPSTTALAYGNFKIWHKPNQGTLYKNRSFTSSQKYELICQQGVPTCPRFYRTACLHKIGGWKINDKYNGRFMEDRRIMYHLIEHYDFLWVDKYLYNLTRFRKEHLATDENAPKYAEIKKDLILYLLKKWGNEYTAKFSTNENGWLLTELEPVKAK